MKTFVLKLIILLVVLTAGMLTGAYFALVRGVPKVEEIKNYVPARGTLVYADDDTIIGEFKVEKGDYVSFERIPESLIRAIVAVEDSRYWLHSGIDYIAIIRALLSDIRAGKIREGASTITQQLCKVVFLSPEKTLTRKLKEATLAYRLEKNLTKEQILELYLNKIYFGHGAYGVEMAARAYFGKTVSDLNLAEATLLSGLIRAPTRYSPYNNLEKAKQRQRIVLTRMQHEGYLTQEQADEAYMEPLYLSSVKHKQYTPNYFLEYIRKHLEDRYGAELIYKGGLKVYTTLNRTMQTAAMTSVKEGLRELDKRQGFRGPLGHKKIDPRELATEETPGSVRLKKNDIVTATVLEVTASEATVRARGVTGKLTVGDAAWVKKLIDSRGNTLKRFKKLKLTDIFTVGDLITVRVKDAGGTAPVFALDQEPLVQGALVAMEPVTGYIRAMVGGYDFSKSEFNRAVSARRQAGSVFKPIIYAAAMDHDYTPASVIIDEPMTYPNEEEGDWEPENYDEKFHGATRLREGLTHSRNIVTVRLLEEVGVERAIQFARKLGIAGPFPHNLTLGLGSLSVSPFEMTSAVCVFATGGARMTPTAIKYILDPEGTILENNKPERRQVISPQTAFLATSMLEDVIKKGTGWRAKALKRPVAGKTGTTNDYRDAWFVGFTQELAAGVWVGFDGARTLGKGETGSKAAAPVWVSFMQRALSATAPFREQEKLVPIPDGIVTAVIDPLTGLLATNETQKMVEFFREGTVPTVYSTEFYRDIVMRQKEELLRRKKKMSKKL